MLVSSGCIAAAVLQITLSMLMLIVDYQQVWTCSRMPTKRCKKVSLLTGGLHPSYTWFLGPTKARTPNSTLIGSSGFVWLMVVSSRCPCRPLNIGSIKLHLMLWITMWLKMRVNLCSYRVVVPLTNCVFVLSGIEEIWCRIWRSSWPKPSKHCHLRRHLHAVRSCKRCMWYVIVYVFLSVVYSH